MCSVAQPLCWLQGHPDPGSVCQEAAPNSAGLGSLKLCISSSSQKLNLPPPHGRSIILSECPMMQVGKLRHGTRCPGIRVMQGGRIEKKQQGEDPGLDTPKEA